MVAQVVERVKGVERTCVQVLCLPIVRAGKRGRTREFRVAANQRV